jgi:hypothetical protein
VREGELLEGRETKEAAIIEARVWEVREVQVLEGWQMSHCFYEECIGRQCCPRLTMDYQRRQMLPVEVKVQEALRLVRLQVPRRPTLGAARLSHPMLTLDR